MTMRSLILTSVMATAGLAPAMALASGADIIQNHNGTTGTLYDFGGVKLYQDSRGTTGTVYDFGATQQYQFTSPAGETRSGTVYQFSAPPAAPTVPLPPATPLYPLLPYGGGMAPQSHPGGSHWRGGSGH